MFSSLSVFHLLFGLHLLFPPFTRSSLPLFPAAALRGQRSVDQPPPHSLSVVFYSYTVHFHLPLD